MGRKCKICEVSISETAGAADSQQEERCQNTFKPSSAPNPAFLPPLGDDRTCRICERCKEDHNRNCFPMGGSFCKQKAPDLCCDCGRDLGIQFFYSRPPCERCMAKEAERVNESYADHLVVLLHGIDGLPSELLNLKQQLHRRKIKGQHQFAVLAPESYVKHTHSGIECCANLVKDSVLKYIQRCGDNLKFISFVGHSLGGVIARYALALLHAEDGKVAGLIPGILVLTASPTLGVDPVPGLPWIPRVVGYAVGGKSVKELVTPQDKGSTLRKMTQEPEFLDALKSFQHRIMYSVEKGDHIIAFIRSFLVSAAEVRKEGQRKQLSESLEIVHTKARFSTEPYAQPLEEVGWERVLVAMHPSTVASAIPGLWHLIPKGHSKIACNHKEGNFNDPEGNLVMEHVTEYMADNGMRLRDKFFEK